MIRLGAGFDVGVVSAGLCVSTGSESVTGGGAGAASCAFSEAAKAHAKKVARNTHLVAIRVLLLLYSGPFND
jgi:hypothetical protein